jgi:hypothetical protein
MRLKAIMILMLIIAFPSFISCEKDKVEEEISGDSTLRVVNDSSLDFEILFDSKFIGQVDNGDSRTWSVPSGNHRLQCNCTGLGNDLDENFYFSSGETLVYRIYQEKSGDISHTIMKEVLQE